MGELVRSSRELSNLGRPESVPDAGKSVMASGGVEAGSSRIALPYYLAAVVLMAPPLLGEK